jgi:tetratricopeptide (TPR) repeat protein
MQERPIFLLTTWTIEITTGTAILEQMLNDAERQGYGFHLPLSVLQTEEALELIDRLEISEQPFPQDFKHQLIETSQGLPYFLVEYLQAALEGEIHSDMAIAQWPVPTGLRGMLQERLASLSGPATQILQAAAIIGRTFDSDLLQSISGRTEEEIVQGIEELLARNLIGELPVQAISNRLMARYDFKQEQLRALVLAEISLVRQRLLHRRTAEALVDQSRLPSQRVLSGQIAYHYQQAGLPEQAAEYYFQAGRMARVMHANADSLVHFQAALAMGYPHKADVLVEIGDLYTLEGDYLQAIQQYEAAAAFSAPASLSPIEQKIGQVHLRRGLWEQAICHFEAALHDLKALPVERQKAFEARLRADWSLACHRGGETDQSMHLAQAALVLAQTSQDPLALAQVHNLLGILERAEHHPGLAVEHLRKSLAFAQKLENPSAVIAALNNLALAQADQNDYQQAIATLQGALKECQSLGDRHLEAALRNNLADVLRASGQDESAIAQLKQAVSIFAEIGQNVEDWEPEIWKLVEW